MPRMHALMMRDFRHSGIGRRSTRIQMTSKRAMRCFRHSPVPRGEDERVLRCFGHERELSESASRIYKPYKVFGHRRNSITLSSRLDNSHTRSSSCSSKHPYHTQTRTQLKNTYDQQHVVLSVPEGRDQANSGRMLVSPGRSSDPLIVLIDFGD
jgi:hypothetical protein